MGPNAARQVTVGVGPLLTDWGSEYIRSERPPYTSRTTASGQMSYPYTTGHRLTEALGARDAVQQRSTATVEPEPEPDGRYGTAPVA